MHALYIRTCILDILSDKNAWSLSQQESVVLLFLSLMHVKYILLYILCTCTITPYGNNVLLCYSLVVVIKFFELLLVL